jgi:hypothetical protein
LVDVPSTPADGNVGTWLVPAIANTAAPSLATDLATPVDVSCYLTPDGFAITVDQATITDERLCSTETFGQPGRKSYGLNLTGIDNTNSANEATDNDLVDTLVEGTAMYLVRRRGVPFDQALAAGDKVTVIPFKPGVKQDVPMEANSVLRSTWACFVTGSVQTEVAVVA